MVTAAALLDTQKDPIIGIFHEYAHLGKDRYVHAAGQMEWFNCKVDDRSKATISDHINTISQDQLSREDQLRFKLKIDGDQLDDLISYNQLMEYLEDNTDTGQLDNGLYKFKCIKDYRGPYTSSDPEYLGSSYNLLTEWETGGTPNQHHCK